MDSIVLIAGGKGIRGLNGHGKNTIKLHFKKIKKENVTVLRKRNT